MEVYATVGVTADPASGGYLAQFVPVAVWLAESQMSAWDKAILNRIIGVVLRLATTMFKGWRLPALTFTQQVGDVSVGIALAEPPLVAVDQQRLIMAACLQSGGQAVDVRGAAWPPQPLFALVTPAVLQEAAGQASAQLKGHKVADSGNYKGVADWAYSATLDGLDVTLSPADLTQCTAHVRASFEATLKPLGLGGPCAISAAGRSLG